MESVSITSNARREPNFRIYGLTPKYVLRLGCIIGHAISIGTPYDGLEVLIDESGNAAYTKLSDGKGYGAEDFLNLGAVLVKKMKLKKY